MKVKFEEIKNLWFGDLLKFIWEVCKAIPWYVFLPTLLVVLLTTFLPSFWWWIRSIFSAIWVWENMWFMWYMTIGLFVNLLYILVSSILWLVLVFAIKNYLDNEENDVNKILSRTMKVLPLVFITTILSYILFFLWYILFVIPSIIVVIYIVWSFYIAAFEKISPIKALKKSYKMTSFNWWWYTFSMIMWLCLVAVLFTIVRESLFEMIWYNEVFYRIVAVIFSTISASIVWVWIIWLFFWIYNKFQKASSEEIESMTKPWCLFYWCFSFLVLMLVWLIVLAFTWIKIAKEFANTVLEDTPTIERESMYVPIDQDYIDADEFLISIEYENELPVSGTYRIDDTIVNTFLYELLSWYNETTALMSIEWWLVKFDTSLSLWELFGIMDWKYLNFWTKFNFTKSNDIWTIDIKDLYFGNTEVVKELIWENQFFWSDFVSQVRSSETRENWSIASDFLGSVKSIDINNDTISVEIE